MILRCSKFKVMRKSEAENHAYHLFIFPKLCLRKKKFRGRSVQNGNYDTQTKVIRKSQIRREKIG